MPDKITSSDTDQQEQDAILARKKALKIDLTADQRARFDRVMAEGLYPTQADALMALVDRALADPVDGYATQIGQLNAWIYQLTRNDPKTRMSTTQRKALAHNISRIADHICGWDKI